MNVHPINIYYYEFDFTTESYTFLSFAAKKEVETDKRKQTSQTIDNIKNSLSD